MSVQNGSDRALCSIILKAAHEHSLVIEGECCNLLRRLHMAWGEFGTILLPLWSTEWSHSVRGVKTLVHFHRPQWHKFSLTRRYDCQSAPSAQQGNMAEDKNWAIIKFFEAGLLFFVIKLWILCPASCQSCLHLYTKHVNSITLAQVFQVWCFANYSNDYILLYLLVSGKAYAFFPEYILIFKNWINNWWMKSILCLGVWVLYMLANCHTVMWCVVRPCWKSNVFIAVPNGHTQSQHKKATGTEKGGDSGGVFKYGVNSTYFQKLSPGRQSQWCTQQFWSHRTSLSLNESEM